ncbi:hypothetical protein F442_07351, partial [Phytophthora nicotianae P10297]
PFVESKRKNLEVEIAACVIFADLVEIVIIAPLNHDLGVQPES